MTSQIAATKKLTLSTSTVIPWLSYAIDQDKNLAPIFNKLKIADKIFEDQDGRISIDTVDRLFNEIANLLNIEDFGLRVGSIFSTSSNNILHFLLMSCGTLQDASRYLQDYYILYSDEPCPELIVDGDDACLRFFFHPIASESDRPIRYEAVMSSTYYWLRIHSGKRFAPKEVRFKYSKPRYANKYESVFKAPVLFDQRDYEIVFDKAWLSYQTYEANRLLMSNIENQAILLKEKIQEQQGATAYKLKKLLRDGVLPFDCTQQDAADTLGISTRTLNRYLSMQRTSFKALIKQERIRLAKILLTKLVSIDDISFQVGYSCRRAFDRAFHESEQMTPAQFRSHNFGLPE
jgi:AraC-like DNA-binding protein